MAELKGRYKFFPGNARPLYMENPDDMLERALTFEQLAYSGDLSNPTIALAHAMRVLENAIIMEQALSFFRINSA